MVEIDPEILAHMTPIQQWAVYLFQDPYWLLTWVAVIATPLLALGTWAAWSLLKETEKMEAREKALTKRREAAKSAVATHKPKPTKKPSNSKVVNRKNNSRTRQQVRRR